MPPRPKNPPQAVNSANQAALDRLVEKRANLGASDRYAFTLQKAMFSLMQCPTAVTTHAEACQLKFVGSHCATLICPPDKERQQQRVANKTKKRKQPASSNKKDAASCSSVASSSSSSPATLIASAQHQRSSSSKKAPVTKKARQQPPSASQLARLAQISDAPTAKEKAYQTAVAQAQQWSGKHQNLQWRVVLLIDAREQQSAHVQAKCQMSGIPCEERHLPIGDMAWMAQGWTRVDNSNKVVAELMLGTIIERKTVEDLKASLFGTRYREQRLRLQHAGLPQVLFLIEGDLTKELFKCSADTLHTAVWETRLHLGFRIVQTAHLQDTVLMLKRMHRRILQRTFPRAFSNYNEQLPNFAEAHRSSQPQSSQQQPPGARRRRRLQSLHEMTFDTDPVLPVFGGMLGEGGEQPRFITYQELKAKIERDREAGTKTVGHIHRAMLKQVATLSSKKCQAVARVYPTVECLMRAYHHADGNLTSKELAELPLQDANEQQTSARNVTLGPRSAQELGIAYQTDDPEAADREVATISQNRNNAVTVPAATAARTISRETTASSTTTATVTAKPAAAARVPPFPECIDLLSLSPPQSPAQDDPPRRKKKSINTSFGSLLDDSFASDDDDVLQNRTMRSINLENDDDDERKLPAQKAAKNRKKRTPASTEVIEIE